VFQPVTRPHHDLITPRMTELLINLCSVFALLGGWQHGQGFGRAFNSRQHFLDSAYGLWDQGAFAAASRFVSFPGLLPIHRKKVLFVTSETGDLVKVGGLGDVSAACPGLFRGYHWVRVIGAGYPQVYEHAAMRIPGH